MEVVEKYTESELVSLLKQRHSPAFSYLYDNYAGALNTIILNILSERELANDVLQEVFIKIWKQIESYDPTKGKLFTWMLNIARNASIDTLRSKQYKNNLHSSSLTENHHEKVGSTQIAVDNIGLKKIIHQLKDEHRILIELSYFKGYTQEQIANMVGIPLGTVKTRLRAALMQLRQIINQ